MNNLGEINKASGSSTQACRESSDTIVERRRRESIGRVELYGWLQTAMRREPMTKDAEEQLWNLLIRERPY